MVNVTREWLLRECKVAAWLLAIFALLSLFVSVSSFGLALQLTLLAVTLRLLWQMAAQFLADLLTVIRGHDE